MTILKFIVIHSLLLKANILILFGERIVTISFFVLWCTFIASAWNRNRQTKCTDVEIIFWKFERQVYHLTYSLYSSVILNLLIVSYPKIIEKLKQADCKSRADSPFVNICNFSSVQRTLNAFNILSNLCTCNLARTTSRGFVMIVVVNPPNVPATAWINKWETHSGNKRISSSVNNRKRLLFTINSMCQLLF